MHSELVGICSGGAACIYLQQINIFILVNNGIQIEMANIPKLLQITGTPQAGFCECFVLGSVL